MPCFSTQSFETAPLWQPTQIVWRNMAFGPSSAPTGRWTSAPAYRRVRAPARASRRLLSFAPPARYSKRTAIGSKHAGGVHDNSQWEACGCTRTHWSTMRTVQNAPAGADELMPSTYVSLHCHLVWSTKERRNLIDTTWKSRLHAWFAFHIMFLCKTTASHAAVS